MTEISGFSQEENERLHNLRQHELLEHGIIDLIIQHGDSQIRGLNIGSINFRFRGDPIARVKALRTKQEGDIFYGESIEVSYDGETLSVVGAHPTYQGPIQVEDETISAAIREAFDTSPKRTIITDFDPRKYIY